jgi:hypothetical protein
MTQITSATAVATSSKYSKKLVALSMYGKGKAFIGSHLLVVRQPASEPTEYVALHLLGQGVEVTLKAFLLLLDYDKYVVQLRKPLGHNLVRTAVVAISAFGLKPMWPALKSELEGVSKPYSEHMLRYGHIGDIFIAPSSIQRDRVLRRIVAAIRLAERELRRAG